MRLPLRFTKISKKHKFIIMKKFSYNQRYYKKYGYKVTTEPIQDVNTTEQYDAYLHSHTLAKNRDINGVNIIKKYIDKYPEIPVFKNHLGAIYANNHQFIEARRIQLEVINKHPDYLYGKISFAEQCLRDGNLEMAKKLLGNPRKIETISPNVEFYHYSEFLAYYYMAGWYEVEKGNRKAAEKHLELMVEYDPNDHRTELLAKKITEMGLVRMRKDVEKRKSNPYKVESFPTYIIEQTDTPPELIHKELEVFYTQSNYKFSEETITEIMALPHESLIEDLERILEDGIRRFEYFQSKYDMDFVDESEQSFMIHAAYFLGALEAKESLPVLLNVFRQGESFLNYWFMDILIESFEKPLFALGKDQPEMLKSYILEPNQYQWTRSMAMDAMTQAALHYPEKREEVVGYCKEIYDYMLQNPDDRGVTDSEFISWSLAHVTDLRDISFAEYVEKFEKRGWIFDMIMGNAEQIIEELKWAPEAADIKPMPQDIYEFYNKKYNSRKVRHSQFEKFQEELFTETKTSRYLAERSENMFEGLFNTPTKSSNNNQQKPTIKKAKVGRNDPCPCGSGKKFKKCCGK